MDFDLAMTDELLATTRAVRKRLDLDRPVPRAVIMECVALSMQAPTGSNIQGWRWVIVEDAAKRAALGEIYRSAAGGYLTSAAAAADGQTGRVLSSAVWLMENLEKVPVLAIPCIEARFPPDAPNAMQAGTYGSIYPAVWSFQLALRARGLGSALTTLHLLKEQEAADLLGIPEGIMQVGLLPVGYTRGTDFKRAERPDAETIVHWDGW